jgi:hypothetical protein
VVYEQRVRVFDALGHEAVLWRVTICVQQATRGGDRKIHILTHMRQDLSAARVAHLYSNRWSIETAFARAATCLEGEICTLGHPKAALFSFCVALVAYHLVCVVLAALAAVHGSELVKGRLSFYYLALEVSEMERGIAAAVPDWCWCKKYEEGQELALVRGLLRLARQLDLSAYQKHPRGPKKPKAPMRRRGHVSTARLLAASRGHPC